MVSLKQKMGCWFNERWRTELLIRMPAMARMCGIRWQSLCNRNETISIDPSTNGAISHWSDSTPLTVARLYPEVGARLLRHCLREWPVDFDANEKLSPPPNPDITIVIGVRGTKRLPQFNACINSLRAQKDVECEIIVVEQSLVPEFKTLLPADVRYIHTPISPPELPFNRSWALNVGAVAARGELLVLHDADLVVPVCFAKRIVELLKQGLEAVRLPRFIFYLNEPSSIAVQTNSNFDQLKAIDRVVANNPTPVAITKQAYLRIGGHDEAFYGWGGEDNEFRDRLKTLNFSEGAFLPIIHLWHPEAPNRGGDRNAAQLKQILKEPTSIRIDKLKNRAYGQMLPSIAWHPK